LDSVPVTASAASLGEGPCAGPAVALWRIVGALTPQQARHLRREIQLLASATEAAVPAPKRGSRYGEGVRARHSRLCPSPSGGICSCSPRWEAWLGRTLKRRLQACVEVLADYDIRLALEVVGPLHRRQEGQHEFLWRLADCASFAEMCGDSGSRRSRVALPFTLYERRHDVSTTACHGHRSATGTHRRAGG